MARVKTGAITMSAIAASFPQATAPVSGSTAAWCPRASESPSRLNG
jgi:phage terminase small subunit